MKSFKVHDYADRPADDDDEAGFAFEKIFRGRIAVNLSETAMMQESRSKPTTSIAERALAQPKLIKENK
jgi:hypothetical protein